MRAGAERLRRTFPSCLKKTLFYRVHQRTMSVALRSTVQAFIDRIPSHLYVISLCPCTPHTATHSSRMDYLPPVTVEPVHVPINVPFLDDGSNQLETIHSHSTNDDSSEPGFTMGTAVVDMAAFLQSKFFFGMLGDTLGKYVDYREEKFGRLSQEAPKVLTAAPLPTILNKWKIRRSLGEGFTSDEKKVERRLRNTKAHIQHVANVYMRNMSYFVQDMSRDPLTPVILSIQALLETLWDAEFPTEASCQNQDTRYRYTMWFENRFVRQLLVRAGWQHGEIEAMPKDIRYRYYLSFFRQRPARALRRASSALRVADKERYSARHVQGSCHCESLGTVLPRKCETGNLFHLVTLSKKGDRLQLQTHQTPLSIEDRVRFIAFSHVRSDGLGSSTANSLPACQILLLQKMSNDLLPDAEQPVPFYIDTLCVPLAGRAKRVALRNMRALFGLADKVLVLDSDLIRTRSGLPQENLTRMRISVWMKRLWTVQECAVSQDVYFRFKDRHLSLNDLLKAYDTGDEFPLLRTQSFKDRTLDVSHHWDFDQLLKALALLSDDMQLAESLKHEAVTDEAKANIRSSRENYDKWKLRRILRIGHLALPQMRYFSEPSESSEFQAVVTTVLAEYESEILQSRERRTTDNIDPTDLFAKLKRIQSIRFTSDNEAMLCLPNF
jgi:hypothetical protein